MNNPVSQILPASGNAAILAAGSRESSLAVGQLGIFNYKTGLSIDSTSTLDSTNEFYISVAYTDANGNLNVRRSAGQMIQGKAITALTYRCYSPGQAQLTDITGFTANCNTEYAIKVRLQLEKAYLDYGFNLPGKTFTYVTSCCNQCGSGCPSGDGNELAFGLEAAINSDPDGLFIANFLDYTTTPGTNTIVADNAYAAWVANPANAGKALGLRITTIAAALGTYMNGINLTYDYPRIPELIVSLIEGFDCNSTAVIAQDSINQQGAGYDMLKIESDDSGNNLGGTVPGNPVFRTSAALGVTLPTYQSLVLSTGIYAQYTITHGNSVGNGGSLTTNMTGLETMIIIPCADTTTRTSFVTAMDALFLGKFQANLPANVACPACTVANTVNTQNDNTKIGDAR